MNLTTMIIVTNPNGHNLTFKTGKNVTPKDPVGMVNQQEESELAEEMSFAK